MLACVAACTAPLLLAGGLTAGLGGLLSGSEIVPGIILATTALGAHLWWLRKRRASVSGAARHADRAPPLTDRSRKHHRSPTSNQRRVVLRSLRLLV